MLATPTWSISSCAPSGTDHKDRVPVDEERLDHLQKLSALSTPDRATEKARMLRHMTSHIHFVREVQQVDTQDASALRSIRVETDSAFSDNQISIDSVKDALLSEETSGRHFMQIRRRIASTSDYKSNGGPKIMDSAERKSGNYFVVDRERL